MSPASCQSYLLLLIYGAAVYFSQIGIDTFGHNWVSYNGIRFPKRNPLHSLPGILLWGLMFGLPFLFSCPYFTAGIVAGMIVHWLEDMVTEGGVYIRKKRIKLPFGIKYNDPVANRVAILVFMVLFASFLFHDIFNSFASSPVTAIYYVFVLIYSVFAFISVSV